MRFEVLMDDNKAFLEYRMKDGDIALMHTEVRKYYQEKELQAH